VRAEGQLAYLNRQPFRNLYAFVIGQAAQLAHLLDDRLLLIGQHDLLWLRAERGRAWQKNGRSEDPPNGAQSKSNSDHQ
jgi:hypothetical protein